MDEHVGEHRAPEPGASRNKLKQFRRECGANNAGDDTYLRPPCNRLLPAEARDDSLSEPRDARRKGTAEGADLVRSASVSFVCSALAGTAWSVAAQKRKALRTALTPFSTARFTGDEEPACRFARTSVVCCGITWMRRASAA